MTSKVTGEGDVVKKKTDLTPIKNKNNIEIIIRMPSNSNFSFLTIVVLE